MSNTTSPQSERNLRRTLTGTVTSTKTQKTITVLVERRFKHVKYGKFVRKTKRYHAHDEGEAAAVGDKVEIIAARPMSKLKRWRLVRVLDAAKVADLDRDLTQESAQREERARQAAEAEAAEAAAKAAPQGGEA